MLNRTKLSKLQDKYELVPVCPETLGGLPIPRLPSERQGALVHMRNGGDVTREFTKGAEIALTMAKDHHITKALLKEKSPSCGTKQIYDGTFSRTLITGMGVTAELLKKNGIKVYNENDIEELL
ncbi:MAG: DUF523 domain-containing protein [Firmicutes bacterium]|nr:DUF523 domain-containing protein [Bacillota bacterium]